ncbi:MliC family protein [Flavisphingomonas formosensis]|uniref:MliC family protein n=1 Tax=Flavisphingomonas formosensis TaxID=861534 RepID=UPI0012FA7DF9|nr:MliC family protein [Sphingomonas formosensis]
MRRGMVLAGLVLGLAGCSDRQVGKDAAQPAESALSNDVAAASNALLASAPVDSACASQIGVAATVCADPALARMDKEVARLFGLVRSGPSVTPDMVPALDQAQRNWTLERDRCGTGDVAKNCLVASYVGRIDDLRSNYADARAAPDPAAADDGTGEADGTPPRPASSGPFTVKCKGMTEPIHAVFVNVDPDLVRLRWDQDALIMTQEPAASGVRYTGKGSAGDYVFWTKGSSAQFTRPREKAVSCTMEPETPAS